MRKLLFSFFALSFLLAGCTTAPLTPGTTHRVTEIRFLEQNDVTHIGIFLDPPLETYEPEILADRAGLLLRLPETDVTRVETPEETSSSTLQQISLTQSQEPPEGVIQLIFRESPDFKTIRTAYGLRFEIKTQIGPKAVIATERGTLQKTALLPTTTPSTKEQPITEEAQPSESAEKDLDELEILDEKATGEDLEEIRRLEEEEKQQEKEKPQAELPHAPEPEKPTPDKGAKVTPVLPEVIQVDLIETDELDQIAITTNKAVEPQFSENPAEKEIILEFPDTKWSIPLQRKFSQRGDSVIEWVEGLQKEDPYRSSQVILKLKTPLQAHVEREANRFLVSFQKPKKIESEADLSASEGFQGYLTSPVPMAGRKVSLEFRDAPLREILQLLAKTGDFNVLLGPEGDKRTHIHLTLVPWDQALITLLEIERLGYVREGNILRISPLDDLRKEKELARAALEAQKKLQPTRLLLVNLQHRKAYDMKRHIYTVLSNRGTVTIDSKLNAIIVRDIPETLGRVQELIRRLDLPPQS